MIRIRLYQHWQIVWKKWSTRFNAIGIALLSYLSFVPDAAIKIWSAMPDDIKAYISPEYSFWIPLIFFALGMLSTYVKQEKLQREIESLKNGKT